MWDLNPRRSPGPPVGYFQDLETVASGPHRHRWVSSLGEQMRTT